jgi:hypothetical protein
MCPIHRFGESDHKKVLEKLRLTTFRVRSFLWIETTGNEPLEGFSFISDFTQTGVGLYLREKIPATIRVRIAFEEEQATSYRGTVVWANRFAFRQQFLGHEALQFRIGVRYQFGSEAERQRYIKYLNELRERALLVKGGMKF